MMSVGDIMSTQGDIELIDVSLQTCKLNDFMNDLLHINHRILPMYS